MSPRNAKIFTAVGLAMAGQPHPCIVGSDWNMEPRVVRDFSFPVQAQIELAIPGRTACRTATSLTTLDYFGLSTGAMRMLASCSADLNCGAWRKAPRP
eukprot:4752824-Pyramimonas_sp.AAC.1